MQVEVMRVLVFASKTTLGADAGERGRWSPVGILRLVFLLKAFLTRLELVLDCTAVKGCLVLKVKCPTLSKVSKNSTFFSKDAVFTP
jgi:hypothetical protein